MQQSFFFIGKTSNPIVGNIEDTIKQQIAIQQTQFTQSVNNDSSKIELIEYSHWLAEPNCTMLYAKWKWNP